MDYNCIFDNIYVLIIIVFLVLHLHKSYMLFIDRYTQNRQRIKLMLFLIYMFIQIMKHFLFSLKPMRAMPV